PFFTKLATGLSSSTTRMRMVSPLGADRSSTTHDSSSMAILISHFSHRRKKQGGLTKSSSRFISLLKLLEGNPILTMRELSAVRGRLPGERACLPLCGRSHGTSSCLHLSYPKS